MEILLEKVRDLGGVVMEGSEMVGIEFLQAVENGGEGVIVRLKSGDAMTADKVIVATGSWTPSLFPEPSFGISDRLIATGQCVVMIQLTEEEARIYKQAPLILDFKTGFYIFPPNDENVVKAAIHNAGYLNLVSAPTNQSIKVSTPRTIISNPNNGTAIPKKMIEEFREILRDFYPALAEKDFAKTRMCWYSDTPDADWLIDYHPAHPSLFFATGGSGHGFKFLPNIGRLIADRFERKPGLEAPEKFTFGRFSNKVELKRSNENGLEREGQQTKILQEDELGVPDDLLGRRAS
jgi:sarcosine oxidase/L-pipecolate oxidase